MKIRLAIKTLFRTVGKTLFTFLLIAVLTFSLFIQLAEYIKTSAEFKENVAMYKGTGYVEYRPAVYKGAKINYPYYIETDPRVDAVDIPGLEEYQYPALSAETVDQIAQLPHISSVSKRYMTAGVSDQYKRLKEEMIRYDYNGRIIMEGTLAQLRVEQETPSSSIAYTLRDVKVLAGDAKVEDFFRSDGTVYFEASTVHPDSYILPVNFMAADYVPRCTPEDYNYRSRDNYWHVKHVLLKNYDYGVRFQENFKTGDRYVFVFRFERQATERNMYGFAVNVTRESLELYDWVSEHFCPAVWNITDAPENYLELPEYAPLQKLIDITTTDLNTFDVVYADDMTTIRQIHDDTLHIEEGRWLTQGDTETNAKVCVIDKDLAKKYKLNLGDTLPLSLGHTTFEQFYTLGAIACTEERFSNEWTVDEFEIVGIYDGSTMLKDANEPNWSYSMNTVFVPLASLPLTAAELEGHAFYPGEITFLVDNAWDIEGFLKRVAPQIEAMGLTLNFDDGGWMPVLEGYREAQRIPLIRILLLAFVTVTGLALSVYLFVSRKKKDYAIMRALGTPKGRSGRALIIPITVLSAAAVLFGVGAGAVYSRFLLGAVTWQPVALCIVGELAFTLLFAGVSIRQLSKQSPLMLLQNSVAKVKKAGPATEKKPVPVGQTGVYTQPVKAVPVNVSAVRQVPRRKAHSVRFVLNYVSRHIRRQGFKSALAVLLAALMVGAVVQFASLCDTYNELREGTVVTVKFVRSLSLNNLQELEDEGYTKDIYYERIASHSVLNGVTDYYDVHVVITSDIDRFLDNEAYDISLGSGYTNADLITLNCVVFGNRVIEQCGFQPHDFVRFIRDQEFKYIYDAYTGAYSQRTGQSVIDISRETIYEIYKTEIDRALELKTAKAEVIGTITTETGAYENTVFTAGIDNAQSLLGAYQSMDLVEFTLADNSRAEEMRQRGEDMTYGRNGAFVMDTEVLENVIRTSNLLNGLFPAVVALALLIGAAMCALMVMQTTKDAAIMRALGTTKRTTRSILAVEQILLGVIGVIVGLTVMLVWKRGALGEIALQAGLFAAAYALVLVIGSFVSAALATKKNILELLQTKE